MITAASEHGIGVEADVVVGVGVGVGVDVGIAGIAKHAYAFTEIQKARCILHRASVCRKSPATAGLFLT